MNAKLPNLSLFTLLLVIGGFGCEPHREATVVEEKRPVDATPPVERDTFEVLEVRGKVRASLQDQPNPRVQEGWFEVCQGDQLSPTSIVHVPFRGRLKVCKRPDDPPVVLLLDAGTLTKLEDSWAKGARCDSKLVISAAPTRNSSNLTYDLRSLYPTRCPVHRVRMQEDTVPVQQGLLVYSHLWEVAEQAIRRIWFPYSNRNYRSGICFDLYGNAVLRYCPKCRKAEERWQTWGGERACTSMAAP